MKTYTEEFAARFKKGYSYRMGGTQTLVFPNGQEFYFDDREYYSGRGSKYNRTIRHENLGRVAVGIREVRLELRHLREIEKMAKERAKELKLAKARYEDFKKKGIYELEVHGHCSFVVLSDEERYGKFFDAPRLAATLGISVEDAELLNSGGKTYVFATVGSTGEILELYHPSLQCNNLSISIEKPDASRVAGFMAEREQWASAPFSGRVGMTDSPNHFVC